MNVLIVRNDKLGDFITALPSFWVVKNYNPEYKVIALVAPLNKELAKSCPFIDEVIVDDGKSSIFALSSKIKQHLQHLRHEYNVWHLVLYTLNLRES